jgi:DNA topoisomerase-1
VIVKKGKFGLYLEWNGENKSLKRDVSEMDDIVLDDIVKGILDGEGGNKSIVRELTGTMNIRTGKYGDYIFYKTDKMKKPRFLKLNGFMDDYKKCDLDIMMAWIKDKYNVY